MNGTTDKIKGMANVGAGNAIGNPNLEVDGALRKGEGEAQQAVGKAKDAVKKVIDVHHPSYSKPSRQNRCRIRQSKSISLSDPPPLNWSTVRYADEVATSAVAGGLPGAALRGLTVPGEALQARKFSDFGPEFVPVADRFNGQDTSTPKASFQAVKKVQTDLNSEIKTQPDTQAHLSDLESQPGYDLDLRQKLDGIRGHLKAGRPLDADGLSDLADIKENLGQFRQGADLGQALDDYNNLNRMKLIGNFDPRTKTFGGGISETGAAKALLTPHLSLFPIGGTAMLAHTALGLSGVHGTAAAVGLPLGQWGLRAATRGVDNLLGNRNPLAEFTNRFASDSPIAPLDTMSPSEPLPSGAPGIVDTTATLPNYRDTISNVAPQLSGVKSPSPASAPTNWVTQAKAAAKANALADANASKVPPQLSGINDGSPLSMIRTRMKAQVPSVRGSRVSEANVSMAKQAAARAALVNTVSPANTDLSGRATISTTKNGHTVTNDASSVAAQKPWAAAVNKRIGIRSEVMKGAREALGAHAGGHKELAQLESDLTALNLDRPKARALVESVVQRLPIEKQAKVKAALDIPALWSTYHP